MMDVATLVAAVAAATASGLFALVYGVMIMNWRDKVAHNAFWTAVAFFTVAVAGVLLQLGFPNTAGATAAVSYAAGAGLFAWRLAIVARLRRDRPRSDRS